MDAIVPGGLPKAPCNPLLPEQIMQTGQWVSVYRFFAGPMVDADGPGGVQDHFRGRLRVSFQRV